jgi:GR25 family glycosyltransferase involved in LPS biosynthesis
LGENFYLKRYPNLFGGAHAYLISLSGAKKILEMSKNYYYPIDLVMGQTWKNNLNSLICNPGLVWQEPSLNIDPPRSQRFIKKRKNKLSIYPYTRFIFKIYESTAKWAFYLFKFFPDFFSRNY